MRPSDISKGQEGLLLIGHGTRDPVGVAEFLDVARQVAALRPDVATEACFLEIAEPNIAAGFAALLQRGVRRIIVAPVLLFAAGHAKRDIPEAVQEALQNPSPSGRGQGEGAVETHYAVALESHPAIVELSARRFREALLGKPAVAPGEGPGLHPSPDLSPQGERSLLADTLLLLVGRGSRDDSATAAMHRFAELRAEQTPVGRVEVCFVAMAEPSFAATLPRVAELPYRRIVVQPHLLFSGELLAELRAAVERATAAWPQREWILTERLGADPLVAKAVSELCRMDTPRSA